MIERLFDFEQGQLEMLDLVARAQRGDRDAYATLVAEQADRLYAAAYLLMGDRARPGRAARHAARLSR